MSSAPSAILEVLFDSSYSGQAAGFVPFTVTWKGVHGPRMEEADDTEITAGKFELRVL
jgi:hypothetical protein